MSTNKEKLKLLALKSIGEAIRNRRLDLSMTQVELGEAADLHRTYITDVENGLRNFSLATLLRIVVALKVPLSQLILEAESLNGWHKHL